MKRSRILVIVALSGLVAACAATPPKELVDARSAYKLASEGPAGQITPAEVHVAKQALNQAERSFRDDPESYRTRDLSYIAQRKSQLAMATASIILEQKSQAQSDRDYQATQGQIIASTRQDLDRTSAELAASQHSGAMTAEQLAAEKKALAASEQSGAKTAAQLAEEKKARAAAEKRTAEALAALARLGAVKEEPRGVVITLSGSVLFASNQSTLLPEARARLDQVVAVLLTTRERRLTIEGHTDSQGTESHNLALSQRRADSVRNYLVQREYRADLVQANGMGEGHPIADNKTAEGRANNRRVEIIIERDSPSASNR